MDISSQLTTHTSTKTATLSNNEQSIVNQQTVHGHAVHALARYKICCEDPSQPLFERLWRLHPEVLPHVLYNCNLKTILMFLLTSSTNGTFNCPTSMLNLESITTGSIHIFRSCYLYWPTSMPNLVSLIIGDIFSNESGDFFGNKCIFNLPISMPNLESLTIGKIYSTHVTLSASLPKLKNLTIGGHHAILKLPTPADSRKIFIIETAHDDTIHKLLTLINDKINISNTTSCLGCLDCCVQ